MDPTTLTVRNFRQTRTFRLDSPQTSISLRGKRLRVIDGLDGGDEMKAFAANGDHGFHLDALWVTGQWRRFEEYLRDVAAAAGTRIDDD